MQDLALSLQGRGPGYSRPHKKKDYCRFSAALDSAPESSHFPTHTFGSSQPTFTSLHSPPLNSSIMTDPLCASQFLPDLWSYFYLLILSPLTPQRHSVPAPQQPCGPHAYKNQLTHLPTLCTQNLFISPLVTCYQDASESYGTGLQ